MNKKILGVKLGTILTAVVCLIVAIVVWLLVKFNLNAEALCSFSRRLLLFRG